MIDQGVASVGVETDYAMASILSNFSDEFIQDTILESIKYKFRPFGFRPPNFPMILHDKFRLIYHNSTGHDIELYDQEIDCYRKILKTLCGVYNLQDVDDIPEAHLYGLAYNLYTILVSEFTDRMLNFFTNYIIMNKEMLIGFLDEADRHPKTLYAKTAYDDQESIIVYDNMDKIVDILGGLSIPFDQLILSLSDQLTTNFILQYISDNNDLYKNHYASYLIDPMTKSETLTAIKLRFVSQTVSTVELMNKLNKGN